MVTAVLGTRGLALAVVCELAHALGEVPLKSGQPQLAQVLRFRVGMRRVQPHVTQRRYRWELLLDIAPAAIVFLIHPSVFILVACFCLLLLLLAILVVGALLPSLLYTWAKEAVVWLPASHLGQVEGHVI